MATIQGRVTLDQGLDNLELQGASQSNPNALDPGLAGVTVQLIVPGDFGTVIATTTTDANGFYSFSGLAAGNYGIRVPTEINGATLAQQNAVGTSAGVCNECFCYLVPFNQCGPCVAFWVHRAFFVTRL